MSISREFNLIQSKMPEQTVLSQMARILNYFSCFIMVCAASLRFIAYDSANVVMDGFYLAFTFYLYIFSLLLGSAEYKYIHVLKYIEFLNSYYGKGLFELFIGILIFDNTRSEDIFSSVVLSLIGIFNIVVGYT